MKRLSFLADRPRHLAWKPYVYRTANDRWRVCIGDYSSGEYKDYRLWENAISTASVWAARDGSVANQGAWRDMEPAEREAEWVRYGDNVRRVPVSPQKPATPDLAQEPRLPPPERVEAALRALDWPSSRNADPEPDTREPWLFDELNRASADYDAIPDYAKPVVTLPEPTYTREDVEAELAKKVPARRISEEVKRAWGRRVMFCSDTEPHEAHTWLLAANQTQPVVRSCPGRAEWRP